MRLIRQHKQQNPVLIAENDYDEYQLQKVPFGAEVKIEIVTRNDIDDELIGLAQEAPTRRGFHIDTGGVTIEGMEDAVTKVNEDMSQYKSESQHQPYLDPLTFEWKW